MDKMRRDLLRKIALATFLAPSMAGTFSSIAVSANNFQSGPGNFTRRRKGNLPKINRSPSELGRFVLPFSKKNARRPITYPKYPNGSYKDVGLTPYMPTTGERQEIGLVTDAQGDWLSGGSPNNMLVQAEAHGESPVHFGKVDILATPHATAYENRSVGDPWFDTKGYTVTPEAAHYPSLSYVPYLATGDIYYLEELQAAATFNLIQGPPQYRFDLKDGVYQTRAFAWLLRDLAASYFATPEEAPSHLLPKSYWKTMLDRYRDAFKAEWVRNSKPVVQNTRAAITVSVIDPWMQDYLGFVMGWMVWVGLEDWRPNYEWHIQQAIRRAALGARAIGYKWTPSQSAADYASLTVVGTPVNDANYKAFFRGNLKVAVLNGIAGAKAAFDVADRLASGYVPLKWAV